MNEQQTQSLPVLPIRNSVLFPYMLIPLSASRGPSVAAIEAALTTEEKELVVVAQRNAGVENPKQDDLYTIGTNISAFSTKSFTSLSSGAVHMYNNPSPTLFLLRNVPPSLNVRIRSTPLFIELITS